MFDANFRLKSKLRSKIFDEPLGSGLAYYVNDVKFKEFLVKTGDRDKEAEVCIIKSENVISLTF